MLLGRYVFSLSFDDDAVLPEYKGSTFRGVFGHSLKKVVCALKQQECSACLLAEKCIYFRVFEIQTDAAGRRGNADGPSAPASSENRKRIVALPHPYVIQPPDGSRTRYGKGDQIDFTLLLFGETNDFLPYFIYAFNEMGALGVGKAVNGKRATFHLLRVTAGEMTVFNGGDGKLHKGPFAEELACIAPPESPDFRPPAVSELTIRLQTPLRLKFENHFKAELPFHLLVRAMLRRVSSLEETFGVGEPALDYRGLVRKAQDIVVEKSSIRWLDWKRFSNRQDQVMRMGGMIGDIAYSGDLGPFLPLIRYCEKVHLGKQTAFGLGRIEVTLAE
jgi:hypothetical protein